MAKRRTAASQERMRIISQLARREKKDDNFGMRDEDWDVYKAINKVSFYFYENYYCVLALNKSINDMPPLEI